MVYQDIDYNLSKNQVRKLGDRLRENNSDENNLNMLQAYRVSHKETLNHVFSIISNVIKFNVPNAINTFRIKRIESILSKLKRYPKMELDRMWDIAGCRIIVQNEDEIAILIDQISEKFYVKDENDYLTSPQTSGYRAFHLYVSLEENSREVVEIQIRTIEQHNWATFVEIIDFLYDKNIKEGEKNKDLERFHLLMSRKNDLSYNEKKEIVEISDRYDFYINIGNVFISNYLHVRFEWLKIKKSSRRYKYFVIETNKKGAPIIEPYTDFVLAESNYYEKYLTNKNANIVMISMGYPSFENISIAYSNYILMMHSFIDDYFVFLHDLIIDSVNKRKVNDYVIFMNLYKKTVDTFKSNVDREFSSFIRQSSSISSKNKELHKWKDDIGKKVRKLVLSIVRLQKELKTCYPKNGIQKIIFDLNNLRIKR